MRSPTVLCRPGHADALARVVNDLDERGRSDLKELESTLVESAKSSSVEAFCREVRKLGQILARDDGVRRHEHLRRQRCVRRWVDRVTGLCHTDLVLDPLTDAAVANALGAAISAEQAEQRRRPHARPGQGRRPRRADHRAA